LFDLLNRSNKLALRFSLETQMCITLAKAQLRNVLLIVAHIVANMFYYFL